MNISRLFFSITILLTYPIECFVCREVILNLLFGNDPDEDFKTPKKHIIVTIFIVASTYLLSMITKCLGIVLEINVSRPIDYS